MNRRLPIPAQVHRFRDAVAVFVGTGETVYLSPREARSLADALTAAAVSCETEPFAKSSAAFGFTFGEMK